MRRNMCDRSSPTWKTSKTPTEPGKMAETLRVFRKEESPDGLVARPSFLFNQYFQWEAVRMWLRRQTLPAFLVQTVWVMTNLVLFWFWAVRWCCLVATSGSRWHHPDGSDGILDILAYFLCSGRRWSVIWTCNILTTLLWVISPFQKLFIDFVFSTRRHFWIFLTLTEEKSKSTSVKHFVTSGRLVKSTFFTISAFGPNLTLSWFDALIDVCGDIYQIYPLLPSCHSSAASACFYVRADIYI